MLFRSGDGTFRAARNFAVGIQPLCVAVGDFNGDGLPDLAVANSNSHNVAVLLGNGDGTFQGARSFGADSRSVSVAVGEFNGDGVQDLAVANEYSHNVSVLINNTPQPRDTMGGTASGAQTTGLLPRKATTRKSR